MGEVTVEKEKRRTKVPRRLPHGEARRAVMKAKGPKSAYSVMNGYFRVLFPLAQTTTDKRALAAAVTSVVAKMKS